jgi:hypothetical protein
MVDDAIDKLVARNAGAAGAAGAATATASGPIVLGGFSRNVFLILPMHFDKTLTLTRGSIVSCRPKTIVLFAALSVILEYPDSSDGSASDIFAAVLS